MLTPGPTELYCLFWRHSDVIALHCSLLLNIVQAVPLTGCFIQVILFQTVDKIECG